jgi:hypothetical protein
MSDRPQGPGWWQASDRKWYPPEKHANHVAPPSTPTQPPVTTKGLAGQTKRWFTLAGIALLLVIAALVAGRVLLGTFLPGLLLIAAIAILGVTLAVRSGQSGARKAMLVSAMVLVVALAVPASLKVVYPAYHHFFKDRTSQASLSPGSPASAPNGGATPPPSTPRISSGILTVNNLNGSGKRTYGIIDPSSGAYSEVATFNPNGSEMIMPPQTLAVSPDLTKVAVTTSDKGQGVVGWMDTSGNFTAIAGKSSVGPEGGSRSFFSIGFDGSGNYYYRQEVDSQNSDIYKMAAGSTTNAQKIQSKVDTYRYPWLDYDGSMHFGCNPVPLANGVVTWFGPDAILKRYQSGINKAEVTGRDQKGCLKLGKEIPLWSSGFDISDAVASHDGAKVAFTGRKITGGSWPSYTYSDTGVYIAAADGSGQPTKLNVPNLTVQQLGARVLLKWI